MLQLLDDRDLVLRHDLGTHVGRIDAHLLGDGGRGLRVIAGEQVRTQPQPAELGDRFR